MANPLLWLRLFAAVGLLGFASIATRLGCVGNPAVLSLPQDRGLWIERHAEKVAEARRRRGQVDLLFVGDSITQNYERFNADPERDFLPVWNEFFGSRNAMNLGFDADKTYNVLWRLRHGEVDGLAPKQIVLLIGTNNFNPSPLDPQGESSEQASAGVLAVVAELHGRMPGARILVLSILPTGYPGDRNARAAAANSAVQSALTNLVYARYLDCSGSFRDGHRVREELFYDGAGQSLHPTASGQRLLATAVATALDGWEAGGANF